jgi:DNA processing protein
MVGSSMEFTDQQHRLLELCAIRIDQAGVDWSLIARQAQYPGGLEELCQGIVNEKSAVAKKSVPVLRKGLRDQLALAQRVVAELEAAAAAGARLVTVLDDGYPANLRLVPNLPPFLFYRGDLREDDARAVAVVGTREATEAGLQQAASMARLLAERHVTVVSGLARGIDTAAHRGALDAGGRTIAVMGTGITRCYPAENRDLAEEITARGALVSQFWPTRQPGRDTFPRRNVVTSGISQGTVVIEAASTSGARMQARLALEHGKKVFLLRSLVTAQPWATDYVSRRGAIEVTDVEEVSAQLAEPGRVRQATAQNQQLSLQYL